MEDYQLENQFILIIMILAVTILAWLFSPFLPSIFLAILISVSTFSILKRLRMKFSILFSSILLTLGITFILLMPLGYLLILTGIEGARLTQEINQNFDIEQIHQLVQSIKASEHLPLVIKDNLFGALNFKIETFIFAIKDASIYILNSIITLSGNFILFTILTIFFCFYFYLDGENFIKKIKDLIPLRSEFKDLLFNEFTNLSVTLLGSVLFIAIIQGLVFAVAAFIVDLPILYFGLAMAFASFIPVLGGMVIWAPLSAYFLFKGNYQEALIIFIFGAVIIGLIIDYFLRPLLINFLKKDDLGSGLSHTLLTVLSTLAGVIQFGVLGLIFGPLIAALAITIFDIYKLNFKPSN